MKQYKFTSEDFNSSEEDCVLPPGDPVFEMKRLAGLNISGNAVKENQGSNITHTAAENARLMRDKNIRPGTPEWFQLWFSLPYLTGEKKFGK